MYNSAEDSFETKIDINAVISYNGSVEYLPPVMLKSTCHIKIEEFPFDEQICTLRFGTWTYDESKVNLCPLSDRAQLDTFIENGEWKLLSFFLFKKNFINFKIENPFFRFKFKSRV